MIELHLPNLLNISDSTFSICHFVVISGLHVQTGNSMGHKPIKFEAKSDWGFGSNIEKLVKMHISCNNFMFLIFLIFLSLPLNGE